MCKASLQLLAGRRRQEGAHNDSGAADCVRQGREEGRTACILGALLHRRGSGVNGSDASGRRGASGHS